MKLILARRALDIFKFVLSTTKTVQTPVFTFVNCQGIVPVIIPNSGASKSINHMLNKNMKNVTHR